MKTLSLILVYIIATINIYAQSTSTYNGKTYKNIRVGNKIYLMKDSNGLILNKALQDNYEKYYKGSYEGIDKNRMYEAVKNLRISSSNSSILNAVKSIFTPSEIEALKDEKILITLRINKKGEIIFIMFSPYSTKVKNIDLSKYSLLEDKLIATMKFKVVNPEFEVYTITLLFQFKNVYNNTYIFPQKAYANP